ncbi:MAG: Rne/Rng family ribonuclease [Bacteroidetes bacterium]|uniref:Rne/Rng family ribonuclease n=1 Tax=Candidatus Cryptobacteroides intestinigallinarum TaxID=2840767 RepID=A0A9D9HLR8_9BACT|nr:Rne/Rng family ribonuclease [Candidatus Cryptobacteroides intestinigallinarum]
MESVKDLIVDVNSAEVSIALMENHRLIELNKESSHGHTFSVGDVYLGKVKKILPALNAAFVDIGDEKEAFVHYLDLGLNFKAFDEFVKKLNQNTVPKDVFSSIKLGPILEKEGRIENVLSQGQMVVVQIVKEPISTKGSRLTAEISLAGRNIVLLPFAEKVSVSQKISSKEEKRRLESLVKNILPKNYGAIIRTAAEGKNAAVLDAELRALIEKWESSWEKLAKSKSVQLLFTEYSKTTTILRDLLNDSFSNIYVNDEAVYEEIRKYISLISPDQEKIVRLYKDSAPIFDHFEVTRQIKSSFGKVVPIKQGAYLVIEHTEALHVIDVNSGTRAKNKEQEQNTFDVNCYAAEEIARQLRLRDMGGIVIVDFIDMESNEHKNALFKHMQELMQPDRAKHNVLPLTKFGLMQITRQRVRPAIEINTSEVCPVCHGTGKITSSVVIDEAIERRLAYYVAEKNIRSFVLKVSPILGAYLSRGVFSSIVGKWKAKYKCKIRLVEITDYTVLQNELFTENGDKLDG